MADEQRLSPPPATRIPEPAPMRTNDVLVAAVGSAIWGVALVVLLLIGLPDHDRWWLWVCVTGIGIGLFGVWYIPRIQRSRDAVLARNAARREAQEAQKTEER